MLSLFNIIYDQLYVMNCIFTPLLLCVCGICTRGVHILTLRTLDVVNLEGGDGSLLPSYFSF